jgi:hypothetical protein
MAACFLNNFCSRLKSATNLTPKLQQSKSYILRVDSNEPAKTTSLLVSIIEHDGGIIVEDLISQDLASRIKNDFKPCFDTDKVDPSKFFPSTTQRTTGLLAKSDACVDLALNPTYIDIANAMLSSTLTYWEG